MWFQKYNFMKITIIYDNTVFKDGLQPDWGFSALVEAGGKKILFDTGGRGSILRANMSRLGIVPKEIDDVFISHAHFDHVGGLSDFLDQNGNVTVWCPPSFRGVKGVKEVVAIDKPRKLYNGIFSTGELGGIEQSLCIATPKGIVIVAGCSHPSMASMEQAAAGFGRVYGIVGGLHGNQPSTLKNFKFICATHCTQYKQEISSLYSPYFIEGGAGKTIEIQAA